MRNLHGIKDQWQHYINELESSQEMDIEKHIKMAGSVGYLISEIERLRQQVSDLTFEQHQILGYPMIKSFDQFYSFDDGDYIVKVMVSKDGSGFTSRLENWRSNVCESSVVKWKESIVDIQHELAEAFGKPVLVLLPVER